MVGQGDLDSAKAKVVKDDLEGDWLCYADDDGEESHLSNNCLQSFLDTTCHRHLGFPHNCHLHDLHDDLHDLDDDINDDLHDDEDRHLDFHDNGDDVLCL